MPTASTFPAPDSACRSSIEGVSTFSAISRLSRTGSRLSNSASNCGTVIFAEAMSGGGGNLFAPTGMMR